MAEHEARVERAEQQPDVLTAPFEAVRRHTLIHLALAAIVAGLAWRFDDVLLLVLLAWLFVPSALSQVFGSAYRLARRARNPRDFLILWRFPEPGARTYEWDVQSVELREIRDSLSPRYGLVGLLPPLGRRKPREGGDEGDRTGGGKGRQTGKESIAHARLLLTSDLERTTDDADWQRQVELLLQQVHGVIVADTGQSSVALDWEIDAAVRSGRPVLVAQRPPADRALEARLQGAASVEVVQLAAQRPHPRAYVLPAAPRALRSWAARVAPLSPALAVRRSLSHAAVSVLEGLYQGFGLLSFALVPMAFLTLGFWTPIAAIALSLMLSIAAAASAG